MSDENTNEIPLTEQEVIRANLLGPKLTLREVLQMRILEAYYEMNRHLSRAAVLRRQLKNEEIKIVTGEQKFLRTNLIKAYQNAMSSAQEAALLLASMVAPYDTFLEKRDQKYFRTLYTLLETNSLPDGTPIEVTFEMLSLFAKFLRMILYNLGILKIAEPKYSLAMKAFTESLGD